MRQITVDRHIRLRELGIQKNGAPLESQDIEELADRVAPTSPPG